MCIFKPSVLSLNQRAPSFIWLMEANYENDTNLYVFFLHRVSEIMMLILYHLRCHSLECFRIVEPICINLWLRWLTGWSLFNKIHHASLNQRQSFFIVLPPNETTHAIYALLRTSCEKRQIAVASFRCFCALETGDWGCFLLYCNFLWSFSALDVKSKNLSENIIFNYHWPNWVHHISLITLFTTKAN